MQFQHTQVQDVVVVTPDRFSDERGFFARTWGRDELERFGLDARVVQRNMAYNRARGTLRGMHFQHPPYAENKIVECLVGAIYDVAVDLRPDSPTFGRWVGTELRASEGVMLYVPEGCAHGYITLEPDSLVEYLTSAYYHPEASGGLRWNDPFFCIEWPHTPTVMNERDRS